MSLGLSLNGNYDDVLGIGLVSGGLTVGTSQVEVKVGASRLVNRQLILINNDSNKTVYYGPAGVTVSGATRGVPLLSGQQVTISLGDVALYLITATGTVSVIVQEYA